MIRSGFRLAAVLICAAAAACGPRAHIPPRPAAPQNIPGVLDSATAEARLARSLAPVLWLQRDEWFPLERVVAVLHPTKRIIAYHLLWRDDIHGSWVPFTVPTDEEIVWVAYDSTSAPKTLWSYWHGSILKTDWQGRGVPEIDVQWGKHGSMPRAVVQSDLPGRRKLNLYYLFTWIGLPDTFLGRLTRPGPICFCHGYGRYREFTRPILVGGRIDLVAKTEDPNQVLAAVFGRPYSRKRSWPDTGR